MRRMILGTLGAGLGLVLMSSAPAAAASGYKSYVVGNPADAGGTTSALWVLQGGGTDVDENFVRMGARMGGGDFVVIRASGSDGYNDYILGLCSCDSVETLVWKNRNASFNQVVIDKIRNAEALFIAGGDQSRYVEFWKNTPIEDAINYLANTKRVPIGGTSAGMAIMSEFVYSAMSNSSLDSAEGLANPFHKDLTLDRDFLSLARLGGIITDQHLIERDRIGRTVTFLARLVKDGWTTDGKAIAADRETSVLVEPTTGEVEILSTPDHPTPFVYFMRTPTGQPQVCQPNTPLTYRNIAVYRIAPGGTFNVSTWTGSGGLAYTLSAENGVLVSSRGDIY
jgi:cyanophycinase